jgi:hypothetical protein
MDMKKKIMGLLQDWLVAQGTKMGKVVNAAKIQERFETLRRVFIVVSSPV